MAKKLLKTKWLDDSEDEEISFNLLRQGAGAYNINEHDVTIVSHNHHNEDRQNLDDSEEVNGNQDNVGLDDGEEQDLANFEVNGFQDNFGPDDDEYEANAANGNQPMDFQVIEEHVIGVVQALPEIDAEVEIANYSNPIIEQTRLLLSKVKKSQGSQSLLPGLEPKLGMADYELASHNACKQVFPFCKTKGCRFHQNQSVFRRVQTGGLSKKYTGDAKFKHWIRDLMSIPLLPAPKIEEAYDLLLSQTFICDRTEKLKLAVFKSYMRRQWRDNTNHEMLSVYKMDDGTNNFLESV